MINFIRSALSDKNSYPSSTRLMAAWVIFNILGVWSFLCLRKTEFIPIGYDNILLIASCLGLKVYEKLKGDTCEKS